MYLGLGWEEAHHPWLKNRHQYTALELLKHLWEVVISLQNVKEVPNQAPIKYQLGQTVLGSGLYLLTWFYLMMEH